jgi:hypothetical protein
MSAIQSHSAAGLIAAAAIDVAAASPFGRRLYLGSYLGVDPVGVLDTLLEIADGSVTIDGSVQLDTVRAGNATLIPYLVVDAADAGRNRGSQGFGALLRTEFAADATPGEHRVLLILDPHAVETVRSAADDLASVSRLSWSRLCMDAARYAQGGGVAPLAQAVAADLAEGRGSVLLLQAFAAFCSAHAEDAAGAGRDLHELGHYVSDPSAADDTDRIVQSAKWRRDLDRWSGPGEDLRRNLERRLGPGSPGISKVLAAVGPLGLDYSAFTLSDLVRATTPQPLRFRRPLQSRGATSRISSGSSLAVWLPAGGGEIGFRTAGDLQGGEHLELRWSGASPVVSPVSTDGWAAAAVPHTGWQFASAVLLRSGQVLDEIQVAVLCADGSWFPVEAGFLIDTDESAFRVEDEPRVLAIAPGGGVLGPADVELNPAGQELLDEPQEALARFHSEAHAIPLVLSGQDVHGTGGDGGEGGGDRNEEGDDDEEAGEGSGEEGGNQRMPRGTQASPVHAYLASIRANPDGEPRELTFSAAAGDRSITVGGEVYSLAAQRVGRFDGLAAEALILGNSRHWALTLTVTAEGEMRIGGDPVLERLSLAGIERTTLDSFQRARDEFFAALRPHGSVYAIATGAANAEAAVYVQRYAELLESIPSTGRYQPEFDRVLLMDAVVDTGTGERYLAPSNPITVAFFLSFAEAARLWTSEAPGQPLEADVATVRPDFLLPMFETGGTWYETVPCGPFLWRQYQPVRERGAVPANEARLIDERLRFFLDVHPAYADPNQTVSVSVLEPGSGQPIVDALRRFYRRDYGRDDFRKYVRPRLSVHVFTPTGELPRELDALLGGGDSDMPVDSFVRTRVRISSARLDGNGGMPFSHVTFVFRTPAARSPEPQDMSRRAPSLYAGGLAASPGRVLEEGANERRFGWGTFASTVDGAMEAGPAGPMLLRTVTRTLELVGGQPRELMQPGITRMATTTVQRDFMPEEYKQSVWVVHLDHVLGLEAFAGSGEAGERYLIEYEDVAGAAGLGGVTATARVAPYRAALTQALRDLERLEEDGLEQILQLLNAVSGRWALRLLRDGTKKIRERIGTVAAIAMLDQLDGAFESGAGAAILIPLEEVIRRLRGIGIEHPGSMMTDDLLVIWVPYGEGTPVLRARLLEVKYRSSGGPELAQARQEIETTEQWLSEIFNSAGPGRLFRARDLAELLRSSASRASAFGLLRSVDRGQFESALGGIAAGAYELRFEFWAGGRRLIGDVVSVELQSQAPPSRSLLPGAGPDAGLVRLGRGVLNSLAGGDRIEAPQAWERAEFGPPATGSGATDPSGTGPEPQVGGGGPVRSSTDAGPAPATGREASGRSAAVEEEVRGLARELDTAVMKYGLELEPFQPSLAQVGPSVIRFRARPLGRQSLEGVARRSADLGREVGVPEGVLVSQEPYFLTVDIPRRVREVVRFSDYTSLLGVDAEPGALNFLVGMAASGEVRVADLARLPHLLIAGATGSGKSVFLRSLLCSLIEQNGALDLSILLVDPKQVDFMPFEDLPHLVDGRIIFDPAEAVAILGETIGRELERRRPILKRAGVTSALEFYEAGGSRHELPQMVVVVDEFADLASTLGRGERAEFMSLIQRYGQLTRAFGIYLVLATQRPSVQVITGDIKANLTARVALKVQASQDSVTILGHGGAERLRDKGDLLFEHAGGSERLQGFMVTPQDVVAAVSRWSRP